MTTTVTTIERGPFSGLFLNLGDSPEPWSDQLKEAMWERPLAHAVASMAAPGYVLYDIGAHIGLYSLLWAKHGGTAYAFEPLPINQMAIITHAKMNGLGERIKVIDKAVSNADGISDFVSCDESIGFASMSALHGYEQALLSTGNPMLRLTTVQTITLDSFPGERPYAIKIDVEGAEAKVIAGAMRLIGAHRPVIFCELHHPGSAAHLANVFRDIGYTMNGLGVRGMTAHVVWIPPNA